MKIRIKTNLLLVAAALVGLTTSCGAKTSSEGDVSVDETLGAESLVRESLYDDAVEEDAQEPMQASMVPASTTSTTSTASLPAPKKARGIWDPNNQMYTDDPRNLFWDLSFYKNWNAFEEKKLPKNMMFVVENADNGILAFLTAIPVENGETSIWQIPQASYWDKSMAIQNKAFKKSDNHAPVTEKVNFRNRSAYQSTFTAEVPDHRNGQKVTRDYKIRKVALVNGGEIIELTVMAPVTALERFGDDTFNFLIGKFNILD